MAPSQHKTLLPLYQQLRQAIDEEDEDVIHSTLEKLLSSDKNLSSNGINELKQCKTINLIQRGEFQKALDSIGNNSLKASLPKIYCLYRLNRSEEALKEISKLEPSNDTLLLHLTAQIYYRMGSYNESSQIYESILFKEYPNASNNSVTIDNDELLTNMSASFTMNGNYQKGISITKQSDHNTHELAYNAACASIGLKDYEQAAKYLEFSKKLCKEEDQNELASIMVQLAFVRYLNGQVEESKNMFEQVFKNNSSKDSVACAVAANNLVAIQSNPSLNPSLSSNDVLDAQKKLKYAYQDKLQGKLTTQQIKGVTLNNALLLLQMGKYEECEKVVQSELMTQELPTLMTQDQELPTLILSYIYLKQKKLKESIQILEEYLKDKNPSDTVQLALAQYYLQQGTPEYYRECIRVLNQSKFRNQKGVESLLIALYMKLEDVDSAMDLFQKSLTILPSSSSTTTTTTTTTSSSTSTNQHTIEMATELARLQVAHKKYKEAASTYEMLTKIDPSNVQHLAGLIDAMSYYDIDAAEKYAKNLPVNEKSLSSVVHTSSIEELEKTSAVSMFSSSLKSTNDSSSLIIHSISSSQITQRQSNALQKSDEKKKRKKRRNKLPIRIAQDTREFKSRWESKKKQVVKTGTGFGHQGSSDVEAQKAVLHKKGQKTILTPEQAGLKSASSSSSGTKKKKK